MKVGDSAKIIEPNRYFPVNKIVRIIKIDGSSSSKCTDEEHNYWISNDKFEVIQLKNEMEIMANKFKVGDRVETVESFDSIAKGSNGTVKIESSDIGMVGCVGVEFDENIVGCHNLNGHCKMNHGYWVYTDKLKLISDISKPTEIKSDNNKNTFYDYLMNYSESNLRKFNSYLFANASSYYFDGDTKESISDNIDKWIGNNQKNAQPRKAILNEMCKSVGIRDECRDNMLSEVDKKFGATNDSHLKEIIDDKQYLSSGTQYATGGLLKNEQTKKIETKKDEETHMFNTKSLMENFMPSFATGDKFALTMSGKTAVKRSNGEYVIYNFDTETIENQAEFVLKDEDLSKMFILMPTLGSNLVLGDLILNKETFYTVLGQNRGKISAVNMNTSANSSISKETNIIFGEKMYKKVVSLFDMNGGSTSTTVNTNSINPMMMAMMMSKSDNDSDSMMKTMMLMQMMSGGVVGTNGANPMMMAMLMSDKDGNSDSMMKTMMLMQMMGGGANPFATMMGGLSPVVSPTKTTTKKPISKKPTAKSVTTV